MVLTTPALVKNGEAAPNTRTSGEPVSEGWALVCGVITALIIGEVQRRYPDVTLATLMGVGLLCGGLVSLLMRAVRKKTNR